MKTITLTESYKIPTKYNVGLAYYDTTGLTDEEMECLDLFIESLPTNGSWEFSEDTNTEHTNHIDRCLASECFVRADYTYLKNIPEYPCEGTIESCSQILPNLYIYYVTYLDEEYIMLTDNQLSTGNCIVYTLDSWIAVKDGFKKFEIDNYFLV